MFSFSEASSVSESLAELEVNVVDDKSASAIFLDFQFPTQKKSGSFPYKAHWIPRDSIDPRKTVDSQPQ